jgi:hypothetical protein
VSSDTHAVAALAAEHQRRLGFSATKTSPPSSSIAARAMLASVARDLVGRHGIDDAPWARRPATRAVDVPPGRRLVRLTTSSARVGEAAQAAQAWQV